MKHIIYYFLKGSWVVVKFLVSAFLFFILTAFVVLPPFLLLESIDTGEMVIPIVIIFVVWLIAIAGFIKHGKSNRSNEV